MKRIIVLLLTLSLLLVCTGYASGETTTSAVPDAGITLEAPGSWLYGTPAMGFDSPS